MGLGGFFLLIQCLVWMTAVLSRVSLQTVLGEGFAPDIASPGTVGRVTLRNSLPMFWPVLGLSLLQYVAASAVQTVLGFLYYLILIPITHPRRRGRHRRRRLDRLERGHVRR